VAHAAFAQDKLRAGSGLLRSGNKRRLAKPLDEVISESQNTPPARLGSSRNSYRSGGIVLTVRIAEKIRIGPLGAFK
jgi:hypothetical protein